ncbi:hypothetical protein [Curtobacterium flaccumfaciens]|uniref:hypothetical protein n=1 Tax=Curtobacterium flaccumfaciens TaxID=2035 RepID=UPI001E362ABD|nr:hypothetical protein [Curtobacterium allii]MCE0459536.1 hypothetical protein [Curtobacterium allii]
MPDVDEPSFDELDPTGDDAGEGGPSLLSIAAGKVPRVGSIVVDPEVVDPSSYAGEETWVGLGKTIEDLHAALADEHVQERLAPLRARGYRVSAARLEQVLTVFGERADGRTGRYIILTMKHAAALADCTVRTVQRALTILRELGLIRTHGNGRIGPAVSPAERLAMRQTGDRQTGIPVVRRITRLPEWIRSRTFVSPSPSATRSVPRRSKTHRNITNRGGVDNSVSWDALRIARELDRPGHNGGRFLRGRVHLNALARALDRFGVSPTMNGDAIWEALGHSPALGARSPIGWLLSRLRPGMSTPVLSRCDQRGHDFQSSGWCAHCETRRDDVDEQGWYSPAAAVSTYVDEQSGEVFEHKDQDAGTDSARDELHDVDGELRALLAAQPSTVDEQAQPADVDRAPVGGRGDRQLEPSEMVDRLGSGGQASGGERPVPAPTDLVGTAEGESLDAPLTASGTVDVVQLPVTAAGAASTGARLRGAESHAG